MKYFHLLWRNFMRKKLRTMFTFLSIMVAFTLFGLLATIRLSFDMGVDIASADRLLMIHKVSIIQPLPLRYKSTIETTEGVDVVSHADWFGGIYIDKRNFFSQFAVEAESYLDLYPEIVLPADQEEKWLATRTGAIAGRKLAERFGWSIGQRIPLQATIWRPPEGNDTYEFTLEGIYEGSTKSFDESMFLFHHKYLEERMGGELGVVGWYILRIDDPERAAEIGKRLDAQFANSESETKTSPEKAFAQSFANQVGDIGKILTSIIAVVFFVILLVAGNTMAQSVRERTNEMAVMKTLGFSDGQVLGLVLAESLLLVGLAGGTGLLLAWLVTLGGDPTNGMLQVFYLPASGVLQGIVFIVLLGVVSGIIPALSASRLKIVDALGRVQG